MSPRLRTGWIIVVVATAGCLPSNGERLTVATAWPATDRERFERDLRASRPEVPTIRWVVLAPGDDLEKVARRRNPPEVLLGGPMSAYRRLDHEGRLAGWRRVEGGSASTVVMGDPRVNPAALERARAVLGAGDWAEGYAGLVRGDAGGETPEEGVGVVAGSGREAEAVAILGSFGKAAGAGSWEADDLLADLLGSCLVDAREEREAAWEALAASGRPARLEAWMTQPPPWPPASVGKLLGEGEGGLPLLETLAGQVVPEPEARGWLLRSWIAPGGRVDGALLGTLARAADGRLVAEPRFRAWLRSEWTAWARQRFRRVARQAREEAGRATP